MATNKLGSFARTALTSPQRSIARDFGLTALFFLSALLGRFAIDFSFAERLPYITFFPMLVLTAALCSVPASIAYIAVSGMTGSLWLHTPPARAEAIVLYAIAAVAIVALTESLKDAYRQLEARDKELTLINAELKHRIRNLLQIANAIVGQALDESPSQKDVKNALSGRLIALGNAQSLITLSLIGCAHLRSDRRHPCASRSCARPPERNRPQGHLAHECHHDAKPRSL